MNEFATVLLIIAVLGVLAYTAPKLSLWWKAYQIAGMMDRFDLDNADPAAFEKLCQSMAAGNAKLEGPAPFPNPKDEREQKFNAFIQGVEQRAHQIRNLTRSE